MVHQLLLMEKRWATTPSPVRLSSTSNHFLRILFEKLRAFHSSSCFLKPTTSKTKMNLYARGVWLFVPAGTRALGLSAGMNDAKDPQNISRSCRTSKSPFWEERIKPNRSPAFWCQRLFTICEKGCYNAMKQGLEVLFSPFIPYPYSEECNLCSLWCTLWCDGSQGQRKYARIICAWSSYLL